MTTQTLDVLGLTPNQNYVIKVFATRTDPATGNVDVSYYSPTLQISTPSLSGSGTNLTTTNYGTDIQLAGGSLFAGTFPSNIGQIDLTTTNPNGTGVVVNQTGVGAYSGGVQEFFLNAKTGAATFAGTITTPTIQSGNYSASLAISEPKFSVAGTQISLTDGSISAPQFRIDTSGNAYFLGAVSASATINGVSASTVTSYAATGYSFSLAGLQMIGTNISNASGQIQAIGANGTTFFSGSSPTAGSRILINSTGIVGYSDTTTIGFALVNSAQTVNGQSIAAGSAYFSGSINSSTINGTGIIGGYFSTISPTTNGQKILINYGSSGAIQFTDATTNVIANISPVNNGTGYGFLINAGSAPDSPLTGTTPRLYLDSSQAMFTAGVGNPSVIVNASSTTINGGTGGVALNGTVQATSTPYYIVMADNIAGGNGLHRTRLIVNTVAIIGTPTGGSPGDIWLAY